LHIVNRSAHHALLIRIFGAHLGDAAELAEELQCRNVLHEEQLASYQNEEARYERQWIEWLREVETMLVNDEKLRGPA
jgi:hypothetical protein